MGFLIVHKILANFVAFLLEHIVVEYKILFRKFEFYSHILSLDPTPIVSKQVDIYVQLQGVLS